ncbi:MAG: PLP-dependent aspartate aminotransferase family protein [Candidatus Eisenbacteria bacterium]|nr:PLP-dependent aspartate aminotransferase family protein [Candidatus Eisenbacteria bacterium]
MGFATDAVHAGQHPDPSTGAITVPIYQTSTYVQEGLGKHKGYEYARTQNPTREAWEKCVARLEAGERGFAFSSGLAAISTVLQLLQAGDHVIASDDMYGGTYRLFEKVFRGLGLAFTYVDETDPEAIARARRPQTRMVFVETPTNPLMKIVDLEAVSAVCRAGGLLLAVDNTFLTPFFQRPLERGADIVLHSTTKYLNGHADMVGGIVVVRRADLAERLAFLQNAVGAVPGPMDCWLALRGIKTLPLRMARHEQNAGEIARWLKERREVQRVLYPGLPEHPGHALCARQASGFGGMVSFVLENLEAAARFAGRTHLFALAESLGGVESLLCHPATMTHASMPAGERAARGFEDGLLRLSVGIEDVEDLRADLEQAFS